MSSKTNLSTKNDNYGIILTADTGALIEFKRISDQIDFDELLELAFEKLLYLKSDSHLYDYIHHVVKFSREVVDIKELVNQVISVSRHVDEEYRWMVGSLTYDSSFLSNYQIKYVKLDVGREAIALMFKRID
jgi:hypothetical protein